MITNTHEEIYIAQRHKTAYPVARVIDIIGLSDCLKFDLLRIKDAPCRKYFESHEVYRMKYEKMMLEEYGSHNGRAFNKPFLATRKKKEDE